jgi:hypothetical protein
MESIVSTVYYPNSWGNKDNPHDSEMWLTLAATSPLGSYAALHMLTGHVPIINLSSIIIKRHLRASPSKRTIHPYRRYYPRLTTPGKLLPPVLATVAETVIHITGDCFWIAAVAQIGYHAITHRDLNERAPKLVLYVTLRGGKRPFSRPKM